MENKLDKKFIEERRKDLLEEKKRIEERLEEIAEKKGEKFIPKYPEYGSEPGDNAAEMEEYSLHLTLDSDLEILLAKVLKAIKKIEKGNYGICEKSGNPINPERLKAFPAAELCMEEQIKQEKNPLKRLFTKLKSRKGIKRNKKKKKIIL